MKRKGFIFEKICDLDNIELAIFQAAKGKRKRHCVKRVLENPEIFAKIIQKMLIEGTYVPSPYIRKQIIDKSCGKQREIFIPKFFPDQVIQWATMLQLERVFKKGMYYYSCASIKFRGAQHGMKYLDRVLVTDRKNTKYCLKLDVRKFYPSIDQSILKEKFRKKIKDQKVLELLDKIVDSTESGLSIGNYTSQWFANLFLEDIDHYIKEQLHIKHYVRYMDDMVLFSNNKRKLHKDRELLETKLKDINLNLKRDWSLFKFDSRPMTFLGYRFYRGHKTIKRQVFIRIVRRFKRIATFFKNTAIVTFKSASAVISYFGRIISANSTYLYNKYLKPLVNIKMCKKVVGHYTSKLAKSQM